MRVLNSNFYTAYAKRNMGATRNRNVPCSTKYFNLTNLPNYKTCLYFLHSNSHNTAFGGALSLKKQIDRLKPNQLPSQKILKKATAAIANPKNEQTLFHIHNAVYSPLSNCKTLDEAKILYPEFKDVIDAKDIEITPSDHALTKIQRGDFEGLTIENLSLMFLKNFYSKVAGICDKEKWFGLSSRAIVSIAEKLNITRLDNKYISLYVSSNPATRNNMSKAAKLYYKHNPQAKEEQSKNMAEWFSKKENREMHKQKITRYWEDPAARDAKSQQLSEYCANHPESAEEKSKRMLEYYKAHPDRKQKDIEAAHKVAWTPEANEKRAKSLKKHYEDPKAKKRQSENGKRFHENNPEFAQLLSKAWHQNEDVKNVMKKVAQEEFTELGRILAKIRNGEPLTQAEENCRLAYLNRCRELYPDMDKKINETFSKLWQEFKDSK